MDSNSIPEPPAQLKSLHPYIRIAQDIDRVDPVVGYWLRLYSTDSALKIDRESPECKAFLGAIILWLEKFKQNNKQNEAVTNQTVGQAHMENFVVALFNKADTIDRDGKSDKNTVRMFYMAALMFEAMVVFGPLTDDVNKKAKYAKFKAAYLQKCFKAGIIPKPGPVENSDLEGDQTQATGPDAPPPSMPQPQQPPTSNISAGGNTSSSVLDIPEVPKDPEPEDTNKPKQDPFILTPSKPPPSLPTGYSITPSPKPAPAPPSNPESLSSSLGALRFVATNGAPLQPEDMMKSQKYIKFANSALQYDDVPTAVVNLEKALKLLKTGENPDA